MRLSTLDERRQMIQDAEDAVEAASNRFESLSAQHAEIHYRERELARQVKDAEAEIDRAESVRTSLRAGEHLAIVRAIYSEHFANERPEGGE